jgi:hypothetical protein
MILKLLDAPQNIIILIVGTYKKKAGSETEDGGCYATSGNVKLHWEATANGAEAGKDEIQLLKFAQELPYGTVLRHHIAGDFGKC